MTKENKDNRVRENKQEALANIIWKNHKFSQLMEHNCHINKRQAAILYEIFSEDSDRTQEEWINQVYLYGSMVKGQDLLARQIFLWLFQMIQQQKLQQKDEV